MNDILMGWSTAKATKSANHADVFSRHAVFLAHKLWSVACTQTVVLQTISRPKKKHQPDETDRSEKNLVNIVPKSTCESNATDGLKAIER